MKKQDADRLIEGYVRTLYGFAVSKLGNIDEAEELAGEIVLTVYQTLLKRDEIVNVDGYVYKIAHHVWVRYLARKHRYISVDGIDTLPDGRDHAAALAEDETAGILRREITYLSETQRQVVVLHYFHGKKVREIADALSLSPNTVKWHLACSRKELSEGMEKVRKTGTFGVQPIRFAQMGHNGHPGSKGDTQEFLAKSLSQNIAYAAYHAPKTINEIAEELGVNPIFVRDEAEVLEEYGFLDLLPGGKYRTNVYITELTQETAAELHEVGESYAKRFAEDNFAPALAKVGAIPDWIDVPDGDKNLLNWCLVPFLSHQLGTAQITDETFSVKRKDGGDYVAWADVAVELTRPFDDSIYAYCGDMWRDSGFEDAFAWDKAVTVWHAWQFNSRWSHRAMDWRDNRYTDYEKLYAYLTEQLPYGEANIAAYQRLLDKGYLLRDGDGFKVNVILCRDKQRWYEFYASLLPKTKELTALCRAYAERIAQIQLKGQPAHMHALIRYYAQNQACALHTRIMKKLLEMGVLHLPTPEQAKGLCTVLFLGERLK